MVEYTKKQQTRKPNRLTTKERTKLWKQLSRDRRRDQRCCEICGKKPKPKGLHVHHIIGRSQSSLLYLAACNTMVCCFGCHNKLGSHPFWAAAVYADKYGKDYCDTLNELSNLTGIKRTREAAEDEMWWTVEQYREKYL